MAVIVAPAPAPASPKHATVDNVGYAPLVFAMTSGELPVAWYIQSSMAYLERWYMEKETVRTRVMLRRGDQTPVRMLAQPGDTCDKCCVPRQKPWNPSLLYVWRTQSLKELNL
jgi:hypothetical protein